MSSTQAYMNLFHWETAMSEPSRVREKEKKNEKQYTNTNFSLEDDLIVLYSLILPICEIHTSSFISAIN